MRNIARVVTVMLLLTATCGAQLFDDNDDTTIKVYNEKDTFMGKPMIGAQPQQIIQTDDDGTMRVYDKKDTFMGKPMIGAQPIQVITTDDE